MSDVVIVAAKRTAIGNLGGSLAGFQAAELGSVVIQSLLKEAALSTEDIDEVIMGQVLTAGAGQNPARQAALGAGLSTATPCLTINQVCGSGLKAIHLAAQAIACGNAEVVIAGGQESMSNAPYLLPEMRRGKRMGHATMLDSMIADGLTDAYHHYHMGITAENIAERYGISRLEQDELAVTSQNLAEAAIDSGRFHEEIVPVMIPQKKGEPILFDTDEFVKRGSTIESITKLRPVFQENGTVTAANASGVNDGAAAVLMMSSQKAQSLGLQPLAVIRAYASSGIEPEIMGMGPVLAVTKTLQRAGWSIDELDLIEANEAFAAQALGVAKTLGWDMKKVNVNGGAIALGHPIGASGCRIVVTLLHEMQKRRVRKGLATLCIGGGMGVALAVESLSR